MQKASRFAVSSACTNGRPPRAGIERVCPATVRTRCPRNRYAAHLFFVLEPIDDRTPKAPRLDVERPNAIERVVAGANVLGEIERRAIRARSHRTTTTREHECTPNGERLRIQSGEAGACRIRRAAVHMRRGRATCRRPRGRRPCRRTRRAARRRSHAPFRLRTTRPSPLRIAATTVHLDGPNVTYVHLAERGDAGPSVCEPGRVRRPVRARATNCDRTYDNEKRRVI